MRRRRIFPVRVLSLGNLRVGLLPLVVVVVVVVHSADPDSDYDSGLGHERAGWDQKHPIGDRRCHDCLTSSV